ncbi:MAG: metal ABC transporter ATP-binding protein [Deltaproteobacteria bacterium]|nr:metal ABC transporter ATP-binding protein [Deltaproteobacteria bacterium]
MTGPATCIEVRDVSFGYAGNPILQDITFDVREGEYLGIIGPNGGGKTTLFKVILGLLVPQKGEVRIYGEPLESFRKKHVIGYVPQRSLSDYYFPATVEEVVRSGRTARLGLLKRFAREDAGAIERVMEVTDVATLRKRLIGQLSGGERQRVFIARALASDPKILILDEPDVGVDVSAQEKFYSFLENLNTGSGLTILLISHDIDVVAHQARSILCLNRRLVCHGPPKDFITEDYMQKLYGKKVRFILHGH